MTETYSSSTGRPAGSTVESLTLKVDGKQVHCLKAGSGPPVVLLHGGASDSRDWLGTMDVLSGDHTFYAPDLIGYGMTDNTKDGYLLSDFVDFTLGFSEALRLDRPVMVGHSLGGRICLEIALRRPEGVGKLVLVDSAGFSKLARWGAFLGSMAYAVRKVLKRPQPFPRFLKENGAYADWLCLDKLPHLKVPTLIVWSRLDPYYSLAGALKAWSIIPEAQLEVVPCYGHAPHMRRRDCFNDLLLGFLNGD
jgi:pimeloyl-ACP methyl ester carboxylesterase